MPEGDIWAPEYETMPRPEIEQLQVERLQATINRSFRNVRFYQQMFEEYDIAPEDVTSLDDLQRLPFTSRHHLRDAYPYGMFALPLREVVRIHASTAASGPATVFGYTNNDLEDWGHLIARNLAAAGITKEDVVQIFFGHGLFAGGFGLHSGAELIGASVLPVSATDIASQVKVMQDFRTTVLIGLPGYALQIAYVMKQMDVDPNSLSLRIGVFGGEPWSEKTRQEIEHRLHISTTDIYGLAEMAGPGVAAECQHQCGLHIAEDHFIVEIIDPDTGQQLQEGERGELVFTSIRKEGMPLLRYRTGDISAITTEPCQCGRTMARMQRVEQRVDDMITVHGENIFPQDIARLIEPVEGVGPQVRLIADRIDGRDTLELEVVLARVLNGDTVGSIEKKEHQLQRLLEQALGFDVAVSIINPGSLPDDEQDTISVIDRRSM